MKQLTIVVRPITAEAVLRAVGELDVNACPRAGSQGL